MSATATVIARDHHEALSAALTEMRTLRRSVAQDRLRAALEASGGERTDEVEAAEQERDMLEARIASLDGHLRRSPVSDGEAGPGSAGPGSRVTIRRAAGGAPRSYTLVLPMAGDPRSGLLAVDSPLGAAILGRRPGDEIIVDGPAGAQTVVVEEVSQGEL